MAMEAERPLARLGALSKGLLYTATVFEAINFIILILGGVGILAISSAFGWWDPLSTTCGIVYIIEGFLIVLCLIYLFKNETWALAGLIVINLLTILMNLVIIGMYYDSLSSMGMDLFYVFLNIISIILLIAYAMVSAEPVRKHERPYPYGAPPPGPVPIKKTITCPECKCQIHADEPCPICSGEPDT